MPHTPPLNVLIVGGGLAGLATASALVNVAKILSVRVLEATSEESFSDPTAGAAIQLGPNGLRALKYVFAKDGEKVVAEILAQGTTTKGNVLLGLPGVGKMTIPDMAESETGLPQVLIPWGALRATLKKNLPDSVSVVTGQGQAFSGYKVEENGAVSPLMHCKGHGLGIDEAWNKPSLVVGADGKRSTFRQFVRLNSQMLDTASSEALETLRGSDLNHGSRTNIKAVVQQPIGSASSDFKYEDNHSYSYFAPGGGVALFAGPAGKGYTYWAISIADTPPMEGETSATSTPFASEGGDTEQVKAKLLEALSALEYPSAECDLCKTLVEKTDPTKILIQRSEEAKDIGPNLHTEDGRVVLVGDAAHAMSGSYGQAANFCFEDAATLAACLKEESESTGGDTKAALEKYSSMRVSRCIEMQERSAERAAKSMKGEQIEDVSHWIFRWEAP
jgi:2-polyprenyl-6-methoxyphenol hydroxylase-like FAD-dependent oxidoreductase